MTAINSGRIALQARVGLARLGVPAGVVVISLLFGMSTWIGYAVNVRNQERQKDDLMRKWQEPRVLVDAATKGSDDEQKLRNFYDVLGNRSEAERDIKTIFEIAEQSDISLDQGEYQWQSDKDNSTYHYRILLPVKGSYGAIRRFCERVLLTLPFASLDELSFTRESVNEDEPDASLRFTLYLRDVPRPAGKAQ